MSVSPSTPAPQDSGARTMRILGLVVIGVVVLCGLVGSCFFALNLLLPLLAQ